MPNMPGPEDDGGSWNEVVNADGTVTKLENGTTPDALLWLIPIWVIVGLLVTCSLKYCCSNYLARGPFTDLKEKEVLRAVAKRNNAKNDADAAEKQVKEHSDVEHLNSSNTQSYLAATSVPHALSLVKQPPTSSGYGAPLSSFHPHTLPPLAAPPLHLSPPPPFLNAPTSMHRMSIVVPPPAPAPPPFAAAVLHIRPRQPTTQPSSLPPTPSTPPRPPSAMVVT